ncbi:MAG: lectin like domain-containing protein [Oscillospiraceae bacterium]|jgi:C1A family cysteine protease|nr:lectin like domain-containing protein [Oscillospiraceae bacterium]
MPKKSNTFCRRMTAAALALLLLAGSAPAASAAAPKPALSAKLTGMQLCTAAPKIAPDPSKAAVPAPGTKAERPDPLAQKEPEGIAAAEGEPAVVNPLYTEWQASGGTAGKTPAKYVTQFEAKATARATKSALPTTYTSPYITSAKNQDPHGTCWDFAATAVVESYLMKTGADAAPDFSEEHMRYALSYTQDNPFGQDRGPGDGGHERMAAAYFTRAMVAGTVAEADMPYSNRTSSRSIVEFASKTRQGLVTGMRFIPNLDENTTPGSERSGQYKEAVKNAVLNYGAADVSYYAGGSNDKTLADGMITVYSPNAWMDHSVTVFGWDDNYPASNFSGSPAGNGAWLVKNSWGDDWSKDGCFWMSYYTWVGDVTYVTGYEPNFSGAIYDYSPLGTGEFRTVTGNTVYASNVFIAPENTALDKVQYYNTNINSAYTVYVKVGTDAAYQLAKNATATAAAATGSFTDEGYYTIDVANVNVPAGSKVAIVIKTTGSNLSVPLEDKYAWTVAEENQSFYGTSAAMNTDSGKTLGCNINLRAVMTAGSSLTDGQPLVLPAHCTISYDSNGGTGGPGTQTVIPGRSQLESTIPLRPGYEFAGWSLSAGGAAAYYPGGAINAEGDLQLYAVWTPCPTLVLDTDTDCKINYPGQMRLFQFTPATTGMYRFAARSNTDTVARLYDADLNSLASNDDSSSLDFSFVYELTAGETYYYGAYLYDTGEKTSFTIRLTKLTAPTPIVPDTNVTVTTASDMEEVFYSFTPAADGFYRFYSTGTSDSVGRLYDTDYTVLDSNDDYQGDVNFCLQAYLTGGTAYYFSVAHYPDGGGTSVVRLESFEQTCYPLDIVLHFPGTITLNETAAVDIDTSGYWQAFAFTPTRSGDYTFYSVAIADGVDPYGGLFDADGYWLAENDDYTFTDRNFRFSYYLEAGQTYYLVAGLYEGTGSYTVRAEQGKVKDPYITAWGIVTAFENNFWNNVLYWVCFGWIWMAFFPLYGVVMF